MNDNGNAEYVSCDDSTHDHKSLDASRACAAGAPLYRVTVTYRWTDGNDGDVPRSQTTTSTDPNGVVAIWLDAFSGNARLEAVTAEAQ